MQIVISILAIHLIFSGIIKAQYFKIELVKDINPGVGSSLPDNLVNAGNNIYFAADDGTHGTEFWKTDGTENGTQMVMNINNVGNNSSFPQNFTVANNNLYFGANDGINGRELWKFPFTAAGNPVPTLVKDIYPGPNSSFPSDIIELSGTIRFTADDGISGNEIWQSNGNMAGTNLFYDINLGAGSSNPNSKIKLAITFYFRTTVNDGLFNRGNMVSVNTYDDDKILARNFSVVNNTLYFSGSGFQNNIDIIGTELFKVQDGTSISLVRDINIGNVSSNPQHLTNFNNSLYFTASNSSTERSLYKSDGTGVGTAKIKSFAPITTFSDLIDVNGILYFFAKNASQVDLWKSDGTTNGTVFVKTVNNIGFLTDTYINVSGKLIFENETDAFGLEIWQSDGSSVGTYMIKDLYPGINHANPGDFFINNDVLYFTANDGVHGAELFKLYNCYGPTDNYTLKNGNWGDPTVWSCGRVPDTFESVKIKNHTINLNGNYSSAGIIFDVGGQLTIPTGNTLTKTIPPI